MDFWCRCSFWDTIGFIVNGIVFFFAGSSAVNFFVRWEQQAVLSPYLSVVLLDTDRELWGLVLRYC